MQKWEYMSKSGDLDDFDLDELGENGWELVAVTSNEFGQPGTFYFKRPKP